MLYLIILGAALVIIGSVVLLRDVLIWGKPIPDVIYRLYRLNIFRHTSWGEYLDQVTIILSVILALALVFLIGGLVLLWMSL